ncbi:hypothetical protein TWF481_006929 [Arthrobotrys musiformis]|uniref:Uncharacterized protein n=1 Tax=Arthrobotrys musiformis TaxID=47236 RepID=A0AAV9WBU4_9PEZI
MFSRTLQTTTRALSRGALRPNLIAAAPRPHITPLPAVRTVSKRQYHEKDMSPRECSTAVAVRISISESREEKIVPRSEG